MDHDSCHFEGILSYRRKPVSIAEMLGWTAPDGISRARQGLADHTAPWLRQLLARKPKKLAAIALANKMARIIWAMLVSGEVYRRPQTA